MRRHRGFTLIELLIVIVIIGILAAIAIPKFTATRERAHFRSMVSDLRNLSTQQELYYTLPGSAYNYASTLSQLPQFTPSRGVTVHLGEVSPAGWVATASHEALQPTQLCGLLMGTVSAHSAFITTVGVTTCTEN